MRISNLSPSYKMPASWDFQPANPGEDLERDKIADHGVAPPWKKEGGGTQRAGRVCKIAYTNSHMQTCV